MHDFLAFRTSAIRYWERRRILYNVALTPPALVGYGITDAVHWVGDPHRTHYAFIRSLFLVAAVAANLCYSFAYALEFLFGSDDPASRWRRYERSTVFALGLVFAMVLALAGGYNIANLEWNYGIKTGVR